MTNRTDSPAAGHPPMRAPRGTVISCKGWPQEAALRMLLNTLDPEVAERPEEMVVCEATAKPARDWESFQAIAAALRQLEADQTLVVQSGSPADIVRTEPRAPRALVINNSRPPGESSDGAGRGTVQESGWFGPRGAAAASWTYTGTQAGLLACWELFGAAARRHFGGTLSGRLVVSGGMGGYGGGQALAATLHGAAFLGIDADGEAIKRRVRAGYCDVMVNSLDEALRILKNAVRKKEATSVGLVGNCADVVPALAQRGVVPDLVTDQTPAHDLVNGYIPQGLTVEQAAELRHRDAAGYRTRALGSIAAHVRGLLELRKLGAVALDCGNGIIAAAREAGMQEADDVAAVAAAYLSAGPAEGRWPAQWVALSGEPADIARADRAALELFSENETVRRWLELAAREVRFQGLPARVCRLSHDELARLGTILNHLVARGEVSAPMVLTIGGASEAPAAEIEERLKAPGSEAGRFPMELLPTWTAGATWVAAWSGRNGGYLIGAFVADGSKEAAGRMEALHTGTG